MAKKKPAGNKDPLKLAELFEGGGEPWLKILKQTIEKQPGAADFVGPGRDSGIVPVRELMFQALKPNPPEGWKVVVFGQNPYPRVESATGIAMFDNTFADWKDSKFGRTVSMRCIIKEACIWKYGIEKKTPIAKIRKLLADKDIVDPPQWFQGMLTQGVLLLNAALTAHSDGGRDASSHTGFWRPVMERIVHAILQAKQDSKDPGRKGVVFCWWGSHAKSLRSMVENIQGFYPEVAVKHLSHYNPAAQGDVFCSGTHFKSVNEALSKLKIEPVDWLPARGWDKGSGASAHADEMGAFISKTQELHKLYLERLQSVKDEGKEELPAITGVFATPIMDFAEAVGPLLKLFSGLKHNVNRAEAFGEKAAAKQGKKGLSKDELAAVYLYTTESPVYRQLNAALRHKDRSKVKPYFPYLRLLFSALSKVKRTTQSLWRGVALDLRSQYGRGKTVTWWGVSSCTSKLSVAKGFLGSRGKRMLFEVRPKTAVSIQSYSAYSGEAEYILAPGTRLKVSSVKNDRGGLCTVILEELEGQGQVS